MRIFGSKFVEICTYYKFIKNDHKENLMDVSHRVTSMLYHLSSELRKSFEKHKWATRILGNIHCDNAPCYLNFTCVTIKCLNFFDSICQQNKTIKTISGYYCYTKKSIEKVTCSLINQGILNYMLVEEMTIMRIKIY